MGNPKLFTNEFGIEGYRMAFFEVAPELFLDVCQQYSPDIPDDARFIRVELPPDNTFPPCAGCYQNKTIRLIVEQVSFSKKQLELLERFRGEFGETDADIVRSIVLAWLSEKSFISTIVKQRISQEAENGATNE